MNYSRGEGRMDKDRFGEHKKGQLVKIAHPIKELPARETGRTPRFRVHGFALLAVTLAACFLAACAKKEPTPLGNSIHPPNFNMETFESVQPGDKWEDVKALLGDPYGFYGKPNEIKRYVYSKPKDPAYRYAAVDVLVSEEGRVIEISIIYLHEE